MPCRLNFSNLSQRRSPMAKWRIDPDHSVAAFIVQHMMLANVRGQFNKIRGSIRFDFENKGDLSLEATIDTAGIYTGIGPRDEHLSSPEFLDVAAYPAITFRSTGFELQGSDNGKLSGDVTIHGIVRPVVLDVRFAGPVKSPEDMGGETSLGITATTSLDREEFGMLWNVPLDSGGVMVGTEIEIHLDIEADLEE